MASDASFSESRRNFLFNRTPKAIFGAVSSVLIGKSLQNEAKVETDGIIESEGIRFFPLYEYHSKGPQERLPENTSGLFSEFTLVIADSGKIYDNHFTFSAESLIDLFANNYPASAGPVSQARANHIPLAFGDIVTNEDFKLLGEHDKWVETDEDKFQFGLGLALILAGAIPSLVNYLPSPIKETAEKLILKTNRREFLKGIAALTGTIAGAHLASDTAIFSNRTLPKNFSRYGVDRLLQRINGLASHLHPEQPEIFMRNAIMALKIKEFGQYLKQTSKEPLVAFEVGGKHSGIEDFLYLPDDILRMIITYINADYIDHGIKTYERNLAVTRVIRANTKGEFEDEVQLIDRKLQSMLKFSSAS